LVSKEKAAVLSAFVLIRLKITASEKMFRRLRMGRIRLSGQITFAATTTLALLTHIDQQLKDLLGIHGIYLLLYGKSEHLFQHLTTALFIPDGQPLPVLYQCEFRRQLLPLPDKRNYLTIDLIDLFSYLLYGHLTMIAISGINS
jgi:hypothetical protein